MKKVFLFASLFVFCQLFGQKKYSFDYTLVYKENCRKHKDTISLIYMVNSKLNNFNLYALEEKSINYGLYFHDQEGVAVHAKVKKEDFYKAETYTNSCEQTLRLSNPYKEKIKDYEFINFKDTLMNDTLYFHYAIKNLKSMKYQKRNEIVTSHFIVTKFNPDFIPILFHPTAYGKWKINKTIPNGILKTIYYIDYSGKIIGKMTLTAVVKIDKYLTIPNECDYTKEEIRSKFVITNNGYFN